MDGPCVNYVNYGVAFKRCEERLEFPKNTPEAFILRLSTGYGLMLPWADSNS